MRCWFFFSIALDRDSLALAELVKHFLAPALLAVVRIQDLEPTLGGGSKTARAYAATIPAFLGSMTCFTPALQGPIPGSHI